MDRALGRQLRAELRKATSVLLLLAIVVFGLSVWRDLDNTVWHFTSQSETSSGDALWFRHRAAHACAEVISPEPHCVLARRDLADNQPLFANGRAMGRVAAAMGHPAAVVRFVTRQATSGAGWLFVAFVAMALVAGERSAGTADEAIRRLGRPRYVAVKWLAVVVVVLGALAVISVGLIALRSTYAGDVTAYTTLGTGGAPARPVAVTPDPAWASWATTLASVAVAVAVVAVVAALAVPVAARSRTMTWYGIGALATVAVIFAASRATRGAAWTPMTVIDRGLNLSDVPPGMLDVRIWDLSSRSPDVDQVRALHAGSWWAVSILLAVCLMTSWALTSDFVRRGPRQ